MEQLHELEKTLNQFCERLESDTPFKKLLDGKGGSDLYARFLIQTYHYVKFTPASLRIATSDKFRVLWKRCFHVMKSSPITRIQDLL